MSDKLWAGWLNRAQERALDDLVYARKAQLSDPNSPKLRSNVVSRARSFAKSMVIILQHM